MAELMGLCEIRELPSSKHNRQVKGGVKTIFGQPLCEQ
jgi:hypothetical protein